MPYALGVDLGTTFTAAALRRRGEDGPGAPEPLPLGSRTTATASVVFLGDDGQQLVGEAAERRCLSRPDRVVREFKRRIGDPVPFVLGTTVVTAEEVAAGVVRWVVQRAAEREGEAAEAVALTHPASWGEHRLARLREALDAAGVPEATFVPEPVAAAVHYAAQARVPVGATIAVYDLGGGTFDAAVARKTGPVAFDLLGAPEGLERLGGVDFDEAVLAHVEASLEGGLPDLDPDDPEALTALGRLRRECVEAKEALSSDTEATIPVLLPGAQTQVRLVRAEFEAMIAPALDETVEALRRALASAGVDAEDLDAVLLVGGSSRVPLVAQLLSAELGRPVAVDADPKASVALGAVLVATAAWDAPPAAAPAAAPALDAGSGAAGAPGRRAAHRLARPAAAPRVARRRLAAVAAVGLAALTVTASAAFGPTLAGGAPSATAAAESGGLLPTTGGSPVVTELEHVLGLALPAAGTGPSAERGSEEGEVAVASTSGGPRAEPASRQSGGAGAAAPTPGSPVAVTGPATTQHDPPATPTGPTTTPEEPTTPPSDPPATPEEPTTPSDPPTTGSTPTTDTTEGQKPPAATTTEAAA